MKKLILSDYPVIFNPAESGGYDVSFPDFPGCVTFGKNFEEATTKAKEVLELWLEELSVNKEKFLIRKSHPIMSEISVSIPSFK